MPKWSKARSQVLKKLEVDGGKFTLGHKSSSLSYLGSILSGETEATSGQPRHLLPSTSLYCPPSYIRSGLTLLYFAHFLTHKMLLSATCSFTDFNRSHFREQAKQSKNAWWEERSGRRGWRKQNKNFLLATLKSIKCPWCCRLRNWHSPKVMPEFRQRSFFPQQWTKGHLAIDANSIFRLYFGFAASYVGFWTHASALTSVDLTRCSFVLCVDWSCASTNDFAT